MAPRMTRAAAKAAAEAGIDVHVDDNHDITTDAPKTEAFWNDETSQTPTEETIERSVLETLDTNIPIERADTEEHGKRTTFDKTEVNAQHYDTEALSEIPEPSDAIQRLESLFQAQVSDEENEEATIDVILSRRGSAFVADTLQSMSNVDVEHNSDEKIQDEPVAMEDSGPVTEADSANLEEGIAKDRTAAQMEEQTTEHQEPQGLRDQASATMAAQDVIPTVGTSLKDPESHRALVQNITPKVEPKQVTILTAEALAQAQKTKSRSTISALHTPPRVTKSNKPVTKSTFQLPGEAIATKLKAQREERLLRMAEEEKKRKEFKARPMAKPTKPLLFKATVTSRARMSLMHERSQDVAKPTDAIASRSKLLSRPSLPATKHTTPGRPSFAVSMGTARFAASTNSPLTKSTTISKSRPIVRKQNTARSAIENQKLVSRVSVAAKTNENVDRISCPPKKTVRATGAEVFRRPMLQKAEQEKALKEKIDAQKKARMEAAERSKNLARAFAEKKKSASQASSRNVSGTLIFEGTEGSVATTAVANN